MDAMGVKGFGQALRERREALGLKRAELAERVGVSRQTIIYHETNDQHIERMTLGVVKAYAKALEMEPDELVDSALEKAEDTDE